MAEQPTETPTGADAAADAAELEAFKKNWTPVDFLGLAAGLVPFALSWSTTTTSSVEAKGGGLEMSTSTTKHIDYLAVGGGAVAVVCAIVGLLLIGRMRTRSIRFVVFAGLLALGGLQLVRGVLAPTGTSVSGTYYR
jgi:hypothetical protein